MHRAIITVLVTILQVRSHQSMTTLTTIQTLTEAIITLILTDQPITMMEMAIRDTLLLERNKL
jgi:hypothetical protein